MSKIRTLPHFLAFSTSKFQTPKLHRQPFDIVYLKHDKKRIFKPGAIVPSTSRDEPTMFTHTLL